MKSEVLKLNFVANARLKDIVGRGLIYNDNIALIELIKNARDADSGRVELFFNNANAEDGSSQIIIRDFGKGMSLVDIENKWLNIAYSSKRNRLKEDGKAYAGNKGVGRFSCDRLGKKLDLYTIQKDAMGHHLSVNWEDYEVNDPNIQISDKVINVHTKAKDELNEFFGTTSFTQGTVLVISNLRNSWDYTKLKKLKKELEKFVVCPTDQMSVGDFDVTIKTNYLEDKYQKQIDGLVENKIFSELEFRTTSIESSIASDGETIETTLKHDGNYIFTVIEKNPYSKLKNIKSKIYYLNQASKTFFSKKTGYRSVEYGSIFMFLNGFRVFPYGEPGDDWLDLDKRKVQGMYRNLGTRELVGYITVEDSSGDFFVPVSAREGLVMNDAFIQLKDRYSIPTINQPSFISKAMRKLEKFVVDGLDWDRIPDANPNYSFEGISPEEVKYKDRDKEILNVLSSVIYLGIKKDDVVDIKINIEYLQQLAQKQIKAFEKFCNEINSKINDSSLTELLENTKDIAKAFHEQQRKLREAEEERLRAEQKAAEEEEKRHKAEAEAAKEKAAKEKAVEEKTVAEAKAAKEKAAKEKVEEEKAEVEAAMEKVEEQLEVEKRRSNFLEELADPKKTLDALITHIIKQVSGGIEKDFKATLADYYENEKNVSKKDLIEIFEQAVLDISVIKQASTMAPKANFNIKQASYKADLYSFFDDYIKEFAKKNNKWGINIEFDNEMQLERQMVFNPSKIAVFIVNILDNANKHNANNLRIFCNEKGIGFKNDGQNLAHEIKNTEFFKPGITTTYGSGLGLYHCKIIAEELKANLFITNNLSESGITLTMEFANNED